MTSKIRKGQRQISERIHALISHPLWHGFIGAYFFGSAVNSLTREASIDTEQWALRTHYAISVLGFMIMIRSMSEFLESLEQGSAQLETANFLASSRFIPNLYTLTHNKYSLFITALLLFLAGFTDAVEFAIVEGQAGLSSDIMLMFLSLAFLGYVVLGATEGLEQLSPSRQRRRLEEIITPHLQFVGALVVLAASLWEGALSTEAWIAKGHQSTMLWSLSESLRNGIRCAQQLKLNWSSQRSN